MKQQISPAVVAGIVAVLVAALAFGFWKQGGGGSTEGKMKTNLGPMEQDPEKFKAGMEKLLQQDGAGKK